jgi:hypothetical protein
MFKIIVFGLLYSSFCTELQICSNEDDKENQKPIVPFSSSPQKRSRRKSIVTDPSFVSFDSSKITLNDNIKKQLLEDCDPVIVAYWTRGAMLHRIDLHEKFAKLQPSQILRHVVNRDDLLQKNKCTMKESLFQRKRIEIENSDTYDLSTKKILLDSMTETKDSTKDRLWLEYMYTQTNLIHKNAEKTKRLDSYRAWPYIKEIHTIKNFQNSCWNANLFQS